MAISSIFKNFVVDEDTYIRLLKDLGDIDVDDEGELVDKESNHDTTRESDINES